MHAGEPHGKQGIAYVTVTCVYVGQPFVVAASKTHPPLDGVTAIVD